MGAAFATVQEALANNVCCQGQAPDASTEAVDEGHSAGNFYVVRLHRADGQKLGLDVERLRDAPFVPVRSVNEGLASMWNEQNPDNRISPGDRIVEVNNVKNNADAMMECCKNDPILVLTLERCEKPPLVESVASTTEAAAADGPSKPSAKGKSKAKSKAKAHAKSKPRDITPGHEDASAVASLVQRGVPEPKAREALRIVGGNVESAFQFAMGGSASADCQRLVEMGYPEESARQALSAAGGSLDGAIAALMANGVVATDPSSLAQLTNMGFSEEHARKALAATGGDVAQAVAMASKELDPGQVAQLVAMGFPEDVARRALEKNNGNVEQAASELLG